MKVIILDDEKDVQQTYHFFLEEMWADVEIRDFRNGDQALSGVEEFQPDLIITDLDHPGMSGLEFIRNARQKHPELPIVVVSSVSDATKIKQAMEAGANACLLKPADPEEFIEQVGKAAKRNPLG